MGERDDIEDYCGKCKNTGVVKYYHDAGDHFGAGTAPNSEWREKPCKCVHARKTRGK